MKGKRLKVVLGTTLALSAVGFTAVAATGALSPSEHQAIEDQVTAALNDQHPKNVILLIGDGMGTQEITAARYYQGVNKPLNVDRLKLTGFDTTWSVKPAASAPYLPDYAPDSASTGTMWATGQKTIDERISQGPSSADNVPGKKLKTILEVAQKEGKKVGDVSTAEITDATPAVLASHISLRGCQGPANMAACPTEVKPSGLGSIAEQMIDHKVDVLLGGGRGRFTQTIANGPQTGKTVVKVAEQKGYRYVTDADGLTTIPNASKPVLGLFATGNMSLEWSGPAASLGKGNTPAACTEGVRPANEPSLAAMTQRAIDLLQSDPEGFFLQVEGASIDKQDHATNACGQLGETVAFDRAIGVALEYQEEHPDTLIVVSADHAHTSQIVSEDSSGTGVPTGYSTNLLTKDGQTMSLTYGTAGYGGEGKPPAAPSAVSQQHTGAVVPVWASGPGSLDVLGTNDHTDLFHTLGG